MLEGGDGCGKSTQARRLVAPARAATGSTWSTTFEPGATELGARLRALLLDGELAVDPRAEALLMAADRAEHVAEVIAPGAGARRVGRERPVRAVVARVPGRRRAGSA